MNGDDGTHSLPTGWFSIFSHVSYPPFLGLQSVKINANNSATGKVDNSYGTSRVDIGPKNCTCNDTLTTDVVSKNPDDAVKYCTCPDSLPTDFMPTNNVQKAENGIGNATRAKRVKRQHGCPGNEVWDLCTM
ncbi:hypothetical protein CAEBREN_00058 [Caenorhabditis brenneri]|uniref:Uncharacterized protein n=1 Tax=Caenorhabditis brenneri TaxID=135651 RepID=G0MYD3_CAEBE|nr:hypothetical protein CAEBREN_00058 [Caenorhabditis brenneri]